MKLSTKITAMTLAVLMSAALPLSLAPKAEAQTRGFRGNNRTFMNRNFTRNRQFTNNRFFFGNRSFSRNNDFLFRRGFERHNFPVRIFSNRDFFVRHGLFNRFPHFRNNFPGIIAPREFVIIDRDNRDDFITVENSFTGPFSVNRAFISVNHDFFDRFASDFELNQDVNISVDTGSNIVRFNTVTGDIETGDVNISIE